MPPGLRNGLEATIRGAARAWKLAPAPGGQPGLALIGTLARIALRAGAAPKRKDLDTLGITQVPGEPTARACLAACVDLILSGEAQTPAGRKQVEELAQAIAVLHGQTAKTLLAAVQTAERDREEDASDKSRSGDDSKSKGHRKLTNGEIALAMTVFGTNIPYESVEVHNHQYPLLFGHQPPDTLVAPNGDIYADKDGSVYSDDYSVARFSLQATFIHEMAHVWQDRVMGITVWLRGPLERTYKYTIIPGKRFLDYKLEQQAAIVEDYFRFLKGQPWRWGRPMKNGVDLEGEAALDVYRRLLPWLNYIRT